jgi:hypothetical protein
MDVAYRRKADHNSTGQPRPLAAAEGVTTTVWVYILMGRGSSHSNIRHMLLTFFQTMAAILTVAVSSTETIMSVLQSESAIDAMTKTNKYLFGVYLVLTCLTVVCTFLVWRSGDNILTAVREEAKARIAEANERTEKLENENLELQKPWQHCKIRILNCKRPSQKQNSTY